MAKRYNTPSFSQEDLHCLLRYEPETGKLFWKERNPSMFFSGKQSAVHACRKWNARYAKKEAFTAYLANGYKQGRVFDIQCTAHRIIYMMVYGTWDGEIDHINGLRDDNRLENLRIVTSSENRRNAAFGSRNKSGVLGVSWHSKYSKWRATVFVDGKHKHIGYFDTVEEASEARKAADSEIGYHPNHGRKPSLERIPQ